MAESEARNAVPIRTAAAVGAGVIGAGWVARLRLNGVDVTVFDPAPTAEQIVSEVHANAARAWDELGLVPDRVGAVGFADTLADAVADAELVIESVPERLGLKHQTLAAVDAACPPKTIIASSTSGFRPSVLAEPLRHPERLVVGHPFNPVYLLPLVEVVGGGQTTGSVLERVEEIYRSIGMHPLRVRTEIDAHIADRLLEAVWREALWLINDGVATTEEIDDAIRYGFGLRWAQMGLFETYRIAGGAGGMRHFIAQFGECLDWPWTKLMDTPELTEQLIDTIATQSDAQSGHLSIRELERTRDRNLTAMLLALEANRWGAGETLASHRRQLHS